MRAPDRRVGGGISVGIAMALAASAGAAETGPAEGESSGPFGFLKEGSFDGNLRLRFENAHQEGPGQGHAETARLRLGYRTRPVAGLSGYAQLEAGKALDDQAFNGIVDGDPSDAVIADPDFAELNQAYGQFEHEGFRFRAGRQRIVLDGARFVGDVGWRNDQQTYDAVRADYTGIEDLELFYGWLGRINRVLGREADRDSDSHLVRARYDGLDIGAIAGFAYSLDFRGDADAAEGDTFGVQLDGERALGEGLSLGYGARYARITDAGGGGAFAANYYRLDADLTHEPSATTVGAMWEVLGSDDGDYGFQTPLATLHKFNGWADVFLNTPSTGLRDLAVRAKRTLPWGIDGQVIGHAFWGADAGAWYGWELDAALSKSLGESASVLAKVAWFEGDASAAADAPARDTIRFWLQTELTF